jgi:hypothetical protein
MASSSDTSRTRALSRRSPTDTLFSGWPSQFGYLNALRQRVPMSDAGRAKRVPNVQPSVRCDPAEPRRVSGANPHGNYDLLPSVAVRRLGATRSARPVTPEVAGSSPVAPVKSPANRHVVLSVQTPDRRRLHRLSFRREPRPSKRARTHWQYQVSSQIHAAFRATRPCHATTQNDRRSQSHQGSPSPCVPTARRGRTTGA